MFGMDSSQFLTLGGLGCLAAWLAIAYRKLGQLRKERDRLGVMLNDCRAANEKLKKLALYDWLTGLPNRLLLEDRIQQALAKAQREHTHFVVLFVDLNDFKKVNDELGHAAGDILLNQIAQRLSETMRHQDTVARIGGDEFVILAEIGASQGIATIRDKVLAAFRAPFPIMDRLLEIKASVGHAQYPDDGGSIEDLLSKADDEMYNLKSEGRQFEMATAASLYED